MIYNSNFCCQHAVEQIGCIGTDFLSSILKMMVTFPISCRHLDPGGPKTMTVHTHSPRQTGPHRSPLSSSCCKEKNSQLPYKTLKLCPSELLMWHCKASAKLSLHFKTYWSHLVLFMRCFRHAVGKGQTSLPWWRFLRLTPALWAYALSHTYTEHTYSLRYTILSIRSLPLV